MKQLAVRFGILVCAVSILLVAGCGGNGTGANPHAVSTLAFTWAENGATQNRRIDSNTFRADKGANITFDRNIDGTGGAFIVSDIANVPNTQVVVGGFPVPGLKLYIDNVTYTAEPGASVHITNTSGNLAGSFQGTFTAGGQSSKQVSGTFTVYY